MNAKEKERTASMAVVGLFAAFFCVAGPITIPLPFTPVPVTITNFLLFLFLYVAEWKKVMWAYLVYLLLGCLGMPVFSKGQAGLSAVAGPTGGFLIGFLIVIAVAGCLIQKGKGKRKIAIFGLLSGMGLSYLFGLLWFSFQMKTGMETAFYLSVLPFLPVDVVKICIVASIGPEIKKRLSF